MFRGEKQINRFKLILLFITMLKDISEVKTCKRSLNEVDLTCINLFYVKYILCSVYSTIFCDFFKVN